MKQVHDLHVWTIASGIFAASVHVVVDNPQDRDCLTWELEELLRQRFGLEHNTIQRKGRVFTTRRFALNPAGRIDRLSRRLRP